ncbi:protein neprosin-like isoform X2 [Tasmannia lanceolata]|uniref:protein neprosin-like isoform X2 n=1 Tax=Tasmannia lanceolata TaxID=3420 RepID=UPI0040644E3B
MVLSLTMGEHVSRWRRLMIVFLALMIGLSCAKEFPKDVRKHLKRLNKPAVKSIKSKDGDVIDCVHISQQPAFDHPYLKNHTIQLWHLNGRCPENTIPIRRTMEDDILRASSVKRYGRKKHRNISQPRSVGPDQNGHEHAIAYVKGDKYYGANTTMNVWQPKVQQRNEFSVSQIWIMAGSFGVDLNSIEAGWQVLPELYGDSNTRLFTYWTSDAYQSTGCYNLLCSGFVQISSEIAMGATIFPLSGYLGPQYDINILVWKDPEEGNWWMLFGNKYLLGYWPSFLFSYLADSASIIEWGGEIVNLESGGQHTTTEMGSGHFPEEGYGKSSYFNNIQIVDGSNTLRAPKGIDTFTDHSNCYVVKTGDNGDWGNYFYYGGPGRNPECP